MNKYFYYAFLEVLFLAAPILRQVWLALFEILHTHKLLNPFPNDWNKLVFENHECKCQEDQLYILALRFQTSLLRADDLCSSRTNLAASSGSENLNKVSSFP